eukprot:674621-Karenia_brevis.AAC.1
MVPQWLSLAYMRTLFGCCMRPFFNGKAGPKVRCGRGVRQGRTDSMKVFCAVICFLLQPLVEQWHRSSFGLLLGVTRIICLGYADDIVLVASSLTQAATM